MSRGIGIAGVVSVLVLVMLFSRWNGAQRVTVDLGVWTFHQIPVLYVAFVSLILGMVVMLLAGLHSDLRIRRFLRDRFEEEGRDEGDFTDRAQRDLFLDDEEIPTFESERSLRREPAPPPGPPPVRPPATEPDEIAPPPEPAPAPSPDRPYRPHDGDDESDRFPP